jgi:AraC family transcriptional regulator
METARLADRIRPASSGVETRRPAGWEAKGGDLMIGVLNLAVDDIESHLVTDPSAPVDAAGIAARTGTTEHHLRRMFASLATMPLSEYVRRRRMSLAAADLVTTGDDLLAIAVRYGYGSTEAFGRAFRAVHGAGPAEIRRHGATCELWLPVEPAR